MKYYNDPAEIGLVSKTIHRGRAREGVPSLPPLSDGIFTDKS